MGAVVPGEYRPPPPLARPACRASASSIASAVGSRSGRRLGAPTARACVPQPVPWAPGSWQGRRAPARVAGRPAIELGGVSSDTACFVKRGWRCHLWVTAYVQTRKPRC